jgi:hypothetical protein
MVKSFITLPPGGITSSLTIVEFHLIIINLISPQVAGQQVEIPGIELSMIEIVLIQNVVWLNHRHLKEEE